MNVIGGGPVGLWVAKKAADQGISVTVHESRSRIGEPEHCAGLLSRNIDKVLEPEVVLHYIHGARFFAGKKEVLIERRKVAKVIDRVEFDRQVYEEALSSGARVRLGRRALWKEFRGDVVAADGVMGSTRSDFGQRLGFLPAMQYDLDERPEDDFVELWFEPWNPSTRSRVLSGGGSVVSSHVPSTLGSSSLQALSKKPTSKPQTAVSSWLVTLQVRSSQRQAGVYTLACLAQRISLKPW
jgi:hypothetical protein